MIRVINRIMILCLLLVISAISAQGQGGVWTWMSGSQTSMSPVVYGIKGVSSPTNEPGRRYQSTEWTDLDGNFWLFGGTGPNNGIGGYNDLWKFDPITEEWTWVHGAQSWANQGGNYGTQGISSPLNLPPSRGFGLVSWTGEDGHLYMYSGTGPDFYADLWKYNISTNEWTWMAGPNLGGVNPAPATYGTKGVAAAGNNPGFRAESEAGWAADGKLWLFGGHDLTGDGYNNTWHYDLSTNLWTWVHGDNAPPFAASNGTLGVPSATNVPQGRWNNTRWVDADGKFIIFGSRGGGFSGPAYNDVWSFDKNTLMWTWIGGSAGTGSNGSEGTLCVPNATNIPRARFEYQTAFNPLATCIRNYWLFSGSGPFAAENDLWHYYADSNQWMLVWKSGTYSTGTKGVRSPLNAPTRRRGASMWVDKKENIWVYSGNTTGDMWRFEPDTNCVKTNPKTYTVQWDTQHDICDGDTVLLNFPVGLAIQVIPTTNSNFDASNGQLQLFPSANTSYEIKLSTPPNTDCPFEDSNTVTINVGNGPTANFTLSPAVADLSNPTFTTMNNSTNADSYEWYVGTNIVSNNTDITQTFNSVGQHCITLKAINSCGSDTMTACGLVEKKVNLFIPSAFSPNGDGRNNIFRVLSSEALSKFELTVWNRWGQQIFRSNDISIGWDGRYKGEACVNGVYFYMLSYTIGGENGYQDGDITLIR